MAARLPRMPLRHVRRGLGDADTLDVSADGQLLAIGGPNDNVACLEVWAAGDSSRTLVVRGFRLSLTGEEGGLAEREGVPFLSAPGVRLFITSAALLFAELLLIRWISANVTYVSFFNNFLLMGSFLGIGLGVLLGRRRLPMSPFGPLLLATVILVLEAQLNVQVRTKDGLLLRPRREPRRGRQLLCSRRWCS